MTRSAKADTADARGCGISRTDPTGEEDVTGLFRAWTQALWAERRTRSGRRVSGTPCEHLPNKWPEVNSVQVGVAVREGEERTDGRFVIFLPTEMATGTGAHINAPFFGSLDRRRILFDDEYNRLLLDCVVDLSLDAIEDLAAGEPEDARGRAIVDILSSHDEVGETGDSMLALVLRNRAVGEGAPLEERELLLCDDGWTAPCQGEIDASGGR